MTLHLTYAENRATDCNGDGSINLLDLFLMRKYLAKWNVVLGPQEIVLCKYPDNLITKKCNLS